MCYLTSTKCFLFEIKKRDYHTCLETYRKDEYLKELKFYHSISVFTELSRNALEKLRLSVKEIIYYNGEIVLKQGDPIKYIYIVKSGSFQVSYKWTKYIKNDFDINYYSNITPLDFRFTHDRGYEMKGYKKFEETLKLLTLEKGQFIGDLEFIHQKENSYFTAMSLHKGSALVSIPIKVNFHFFTYYKNIKGI